MQQFYLLQLKLRRFKKENKKKKVAIWVHPSVVGPDSHRRALVVVAVVVVDLVSASFLSSVASPSASAGFSVVDFEVSHFAQLESAVVDDDDASSASTFVITRRIRQNAKHNTCNKNEI